MNWRERAERILRDGDNRDIKDNSPREAPNVPIVPNVPGVTVLDPARVLRTWHKRLSALDALKPPACLSSADWEDLCDDSWWLYETHGSYAVRNGWGAEGLFGVRVDYAPGGGLAQVLRRSRLLEFDGPIAHVTRFGAVVSRNPACGYGLPLLWEVAPHGKCSK